MRGRVAVALGVLLLPAVSSAQRMPLPRIGGRGPAQPVPLSPQPPEIARAIAYRRLNLSVESYPMISYFQSPGLMGDGRPSGWTAFGAGTRASYRLTPNVAATMDLTSSFLGSPIQVQTAEIGTRLGPERSERRIYPFVDIRAGYVAAYNTSLGTFTDSPFGYPTPSGIYGVRYSRGFGGAAGAGMEYALTQSLSLTSTASVLRSRLSSQDFAGSPDASASFALTSYRYILGIRYNPVRMFVP